MNTQVRLDGVCDARFARVRDAFAENFGTRGDVGAAVCIYVDGKAVVDLWGGYADATRTRLWGRETMTSVRSNTKAMTALCAHRLVERGLLDLDAPVARYWPEFGQGGKAQVPLRWLLSHRAGLPAVRQDMAPETLFDWNRFATALAATTPWWGPGTQHGYHSLTYGYLVGEVIRRITGKTTGEFFQAEIAGPLGVEFYIGLPASEDARAAEILPPPPSIVGMPSRWELLAQDPMSLAGRALFNPPQSAHIINSRAWRAAEIPASNGHTTARGLARIYGALTSGGGIGGIRLLSAATIESAITEQSCGVDAVLGFPSRHGLGFMLPLAEHFREAGLGLQPFGPNPRAFGYWGTGGSVGFGDLDARVGFAYVMNQYQLGAPGNPDLRWPSLVEAVYASIGR